MYDPGSAVPPPSPSPPMVPPSLWCGVVRGWVCLGWFPSSPPVAWCGFGFPCGVFFAAFLGLLWVFGILIPTMMMMMMTMMMGTMIIIIIIIIIINSNILISVSLVGGPVSSARAPGNDYRFIDRRAIIFVTVVNFGAIAIRFHCHRDRARQGTRSS